MSMFSEALLEQLALGAAFLGSGGGGNPAYPLLVAQRQLERYAPIQIIDLAELEDDDLIVPLGFMGAPLVSLERIPGEKEFEAVLTLIEKTYGRKPKALGITEIGGANALTPFYIAGKLGLPVVDADLIGRAFPELQMVSTTVHHLKPTACFMADIFGNTVVIHCSDLNRIEKYARQMTVAFGSSAIIALHVLTGYEAKQVMIKGSLSRACEIGRTIASAQMKGKNPIETIVNHTQGRGIGEGIITDIDQKIEAGFLCGTVTIVQSKTCVWTIKYQNEYLYVYQDNMQIAATPDIIAILDHETGLPMTSESLSFGLRVAIIAVRGPEIWYSLQGLQLVGPHVFKVNEQRINESI